MTILPPLRRSAADAERFARIVHADQVDQAGRPYVEHLERVASRIGFKMFLGGIDPLSDEADHTRQIAWLHDVIEDTPNGGKGLLREGFSITVIRAVEMLSKPQSSQPYGEWITWMIENAPLPVLIVKLADMEDNSDPDRLALLPPETRERLRAKYAEPLKMLRAAVEERANG